MKLCVTCRKETNNPKYCSRSCSAKTTNKTPKRKLTRTCHLCTSVVKSYRHTKCKEHWAEYKEQRHKDRTLGEFKNLESVKGKHPSWVFVHVRQFARTWLKHLRVKPCANCGYSKYVELCHKKALKDFPDTATLREVNDESNVIQLCPNCHWEFDNGHLII